MESKLLQNYVTYHRWATSRSLQRLADVETTLWHRDLSSSFPTIYETVMHLFRAENIWHNRLFSHHKFSFPQSCNSEIELLELYTKQNEAFVSLSLQIEADRLIHYTNTLNESYQQKAGDIIMHVINHASYHRGQLTTFLRQCNLEPMPALDLIFFLRKQTN